jgi:predicted nucleic acid-binding protein
MKAPIFVDTGCVLALANKRDKYHELALTAFEIVSPPYLTTEAVLVEVGNAFSRVKWRTMGVDALSYVRHSTHFEIVSVDSELLGRAIALYSARMDKDWGLTDCISFVVMRERRLTDVLATDRHFEQAGFQNLLTARQSPT